MKKIYLIIAGVAAIVILLGLWVYLLIYGTPKPVTAFFTDFSFTGESTETPQPITQPAPDSQIDIATEKLRQLTVRPVSGFGEVVTEGANERFVYYSEAGTGHVYRINLVTGEETRISNVTIPNTTLAQFSQDGNFVALRSGYTNSNQKFTILNLTDTTNISTSEIDNKIVDFTWNDEGRLLYTTYRNNGLVGQAYNPTQMTTSDIFTVPFPSATIDWDTTANNEHYAYPKASAKLNGYLYSLSGGTIKRMAIEGFGLTALVNKDFAIFTNQTSAGAPQSQAMDLNDGAVRLLPGIADPSKCAFAETNRDTLYCAYTQNSYGPEFPDDWYKGTRSFSDQIWEINIRQRSASQLVNPESKSGRAIDVMSMVFSEESGALYFINKNDNTLWMYEI